MLTRGGDGALLAARTSAARDPAQRDASPLPATCAARRRRWIASPAHDPLRDDGLAYARGAARRGRARSTVEVYDDMTHGFLRWGGAVDRAHELIAWLAAAAK